MSDGADATHAEPEGTGVHARRPDSVAELPEGGGGGLAAAIARGGLPAAVALQRAAGNQAATQMLASPGQAAARTAGNRLGGRSSRELLRQPASAATGDAPATVAQRTAAASMADAVRARRLARAPAPPAKLRRDTSQVKIRPIGSAGSPIEFAAIADKSKNWTAWRFEYDSVPSNLFLTWRWFDGSDAEVDSSTQTTAALIFSPNKIRDRVEAVGRSALGIWTIRLEKDDFYDDLTFEVREERPLAVMEGQTNRSWYDLHDLPGGKVIGTLSGQSVPIAVDGKAKVGDNIYYHITLKADTGEQKGGAGVFKAGTKAWIAGQAIAPVASWDMFRTQLAAWEKANSSLTLDQRITRLRQMCHKSDLPFDKVIGTPEGPSGTYLDQRPFKPEDWDLLFDSQLVRMPDGKVIEVYHLLVGLDVLPRWDNAKTITEWGQTIDVGQNYSAATWAGDVGAGAADAAMKVDSTWESHNPSATRADRIERYYTTRLPIEELTGDIDAWGIDEAKRAPGAPTTVEGLLSDYYAATPVPDAGVSGSPTGPAPSHTSKRRAGVERFLRHYGLAFGSGAPHLKAQTTARDEMKKQIVKFGHVWLERTHYVAGPSAALEADMTSFAGDMTDRMLDDIEKLAGQVGATP